MDELLHWLEIRIASSLRPKAEEMKNLLLDHTYKSYLHEFLKNEDVHTLYIYFKLAKASLAASLSPPPALQNKCICFVKLGTAVKLTAENLADHVMSLDCDTLPLKYFDTLLHQVYLPLLSNSNVAGGAYNSDKIIDNLYKFTGSMEVMSGHTKGSVVIPIPSLEILKNISPFNKHGAAIHIMETTVIGWIRQIKAILKHEPLTEIKAKGVMAGIYQEKDMWESHIQSLASISLQLNSAEAKEIVHHLEQAKSMYGNSILAVTNDLQKAKQQAEENLIYLTTLIKCYDQLKSAKTTSEKQKYFFQMLHRLFFVWKYSRYYHQRKVFVNLLRLMSNEVVKIARALLGNDLIDNPEAYSLLKEALKMCATFRGNYLDVKIRADEYNTMKLEESASLTKSKKAGESVCSITMYEVPAPWVYGKDPSLNDKKQGEEEDCIWVDCSWPQYNASYFQNMNIFMERCNDVLDLVETMKHFEVLKAVAAVGGAGSSSLDALVQDIWNSYCSVKDSFISQVKNIFTINKNSPFQEAFFDLRTTVKSLEHQLGNILRRSFDQCPTVASQLRLLEVFEGISRRDIVKDHLKEKDLQLYTMFMEEIRQVRDMYLEMSDNPPLHLNMTPTICKLLWIKGLRARISDPLAILKKVSPITLDGDMGWDLRHLYTATSEDLERFEESLVTSWLSGVNKDLSDSLKLPLLKAFDSMHDFEECLQIDINLNPSLLVYLREAEYFSKPPLTMKLPESIGSVISKMDINRLKLLFTRLETVVSKYNEVIKSISNHQRALFEKKLAKISEILRDGMSLFTWSMDESTDYAELATSYICADLYKNFSIVTNNYNLISELTASWCTANLDIFTCRDLSRSYSITELMMKQKKTEHDLESQLILDGHRIHSLVQQSFVACGISEASPAWQEFIMHMDAIVLQGLKKVTLSSLAALLNTLLDRDHSPLLSIKVELINSEVAFNPPLDQSTSDTSVMENMEDWLKMFLFRGAHIQGLSAVVKVGYQDYVSQDEEVLQLIGFILQKVESCILECQALLEVFRSYSHLWKKDVNAAFQNFLHGKQRAGYSPEKDVSEDETNHLTMSDVSVKPQNSPLIAAEKSFLLPKDVTIQVPHGPLLEDFDSEISTYKAARDSILDLPDHQDCGWIHVEFRPIKQVLCAYALKWMWTFTKYLIDQTSTTLKNLDSFLRRTEPQIESITGEERDTGSFMKMMRLFNEVSSKQVEMEVQFTVLQKTVSLLAKHEMTLPTDCEILYKTMAARWNSMKTKVSLAKQRLGPRIQQEADIVSRDLGRFQRKLDTFGSDLENSEVYKYEYTAQEAFVTTEEFSAQLEILQREAKDLKELQELLETTVVDFSILNNCEELLLNLKLVWQHVDSILRQQEVWKKELWQNMNTEELRKLTEQQLNLLQSLPGEVHEWDVYRHVLEAVNVMHVTLPLIEDLSNPAMRTRHWKQLVRQTGGMLRVTADSLKAMTLGDLLAMDLQKHTGDVRTTVQRAMRDVTIESSLKNCEEVWLSRIFDLGPHNRFISARAENEELASSVSGSHYTKGDMGRSLTTGKGSRRLSRQSDRGLHLSKKTGRGSTVSLYESLKHIEDFGKVQLLKNSESVFEELEHHQLVLTSIQPYAEAGSFLDEVTKWQKKLQAIEMTVQLWLSVQNKWTQLEEVFSTLAFRVAMPREAILFADVNHHFCRLMKSVEENPNILQNCMRRGLQSLLDILNYKLERCQRAVRLHLEQKRQAFPRLFFLSLEDTLNIVCYGYDLSVLSNYIVKMFHHIHSLIYEHNSEHECNHILGVKSFLGEELYLTKPLECSGPVENWLPQLVNSIKASLQHHLWAAVERNNTVITMRKQIHSAGARRVLINKTVSNGESATEEREMSAQQDEEESASTALGRAGSRQSRHWVFDTLSDVAYLTTQIKFCQEYKQNSENRNEIIQGCLKDLTEGIEYAAKLLNEIPQKDIQLHSERSSKAERKGNGQGEELKKEDNDENMGQLASTHPLSAENVVKLTNHILQLIYQRDVTSQIVAGTAPLWKQEHPLHYELDENSKEIAVKFASVAFCGASIPDKDGRAEDGFDCCCIEVRQEFLCHAELLQLAKEVKPLLGFPLGGDSVFLPLQGVGDGGAQEADTGHFFHQHPSNVQWRWGGGMFPKVNDNLHGFCIVEDQFILLAPVANPFYLMAVCLLVIVGDQADYGGVVCKFDYLDRACRGSAIVRVQGEQEWRQDAALWGPCVGGPWLRGGGAQLYHLGSFPVKQVSSPPVFLLVPGLVCGFFASAQLPKFLGEPWLVVWVDFVSFCRYTGVLAEPDVRAHVVCPLIQIGDSTVFYGYEYQGSAKHILGTPFTDRVFLSIMGAVSAGIDALCVGPQASGKQSTIRELSLALGKPLFCFTCTSTSDNGILQDICKGLAAAGAWVCMNGLEQLSHPSLSLLTEILTQIHSAKHLGKETVTVQLEDVPLNTAGVCIAVVKRSAIDPQSYKLPMRFLNCFRIVGVQKCPVSYFLEAQLLLKGFSHVASLTQKLSTTLDSFGKLYLADQIGSDLSQHGKFRGSSIQELNTLLNEAGIILQKSQRHLIETQGQVHNTSEDWQQKLEDKALATAIYNCWLPQLSNKRVHAFRCILEAEFPGLFDDVKNPHDSCVEDSSLDGPLPAVIAAKYGLGQQVLSSECTEETSVPSAIIKAAEKCHIFPSYAFVSKVSHLVQLAPKYQTVVVTGPPGSGKTTCIKLFVELLKGEGKKIKLDTVYTEALQPGQFLGLMNKNNGWNDGLLPQLLRMYCQPCAVADQTHLNILHLDGEIRGHEMELMQNMFCGAEFFTLENNECIPISDSLRFFGELDTLANVSPSVLCCIGVLAMTSDDIDCKLPLKMWMTAQAEEHQPLLHQLTKTFLEPCLQFLKNKQILHKQGQVDKEQMIQRGLFLHEASMIQTFCRIIKALMLHVPDASSEELKKYFIFSCIWSFGGWLDSNERTMFSHWWKHSFKHHATFPAEGEVWDYHIDTDTRQFVRWHDTLSSYSVNHGQGMVSETFVHTLHIEQLLYLSSLLTLSGYPVLLAGDTGCGKSVLSRELLSALCLGDVAEMSELRIPINSSTDPRRLWGCLKDRLEWRHGTLHTPAGNKKLLCLLDDLNLAKVNKYGSQPACEFIRQLLDQERIFDPMSLNWKTMEGIIYLATWNTTPESSSAQKQRLLRHFSTFLCKYPSQSDQFGIFSSVLNAHFVPGVTERKTGSGGSMTPEQLQELIAAITKVSVELQDRLRTMFLGTSQRCHYIFTLRDLAKIFRNICLSLDGGTTADKLLRLWRHECDWVYGHRMSSSVDHSRYVQELTIAVQKVFMNEAEVQAIVDSKQPLFSNIVEDDGGLISTIAKQQDVNLYRKNEKAGSSTHILDGYQETFDSVHVKQLLTEALREYNKVNPRMSITFYQATVNLLCRLSRDLWSPQGSAHMLLCGAGCPRSSITMARLAAHLSGFTVVQFGSHTKIENEEERFRMLKSQLVDSYVKAGLKGQRTMLLFTEEDIDSTSLVYITESVVFGSVSHLFTLEQQATIANAMRSEVTNAGLTYSKENAWTLFLQAVQQNIRWCLIRSDTGSAFYKWCHQFTSLFNALNVYYIPHWSRESLIEHAGYHIQDLDMMTKQEKENVCHLLSSMHNSIMKYVKSSERTYSKITNKTFENFAQCFSVLMKDQYALIKKQHDLAKEALVLIEKRLKSYEKLTDDLTHEQSVLEQHKKGTLKILQQIAQDKAVVEQKIHAVHEQLQKIKKFRTLLPEYQVALEKAEYKCSAILENIKDLVRNMDIVALGELRVMQKPDVDIEELMASIIIILKSPNTDLTWAKGAKRQMANLDRFLNELTMFHATQLPQSTLELLEANIKKIQFTPENMERKASGNVAAGSLMRWLQGAVQYYRILSSKVKPLQSRVSEMTVALEDAEQKMSTLQQRKKALLSRLSDLERGFEEATMHKNKQQHRTTEISHKLHQAAHVAQLLEKENKKHAAIVSSLPGRLSGIPGSTALAAGLVSYLGAYEHNFRQLMLTVEWPMAVKERGFPLMIDAIDPDKGHVIEFSVIFPNDSTKERQKNNRNDSTEENEEIHTDHGEETLNDLSLLGQALPVITEELYLDFIRALIMRIIKVNEIQKWSAKDWTPQQMENAAILSFSWQRPALLIDPCFQGETWLQDILGTSSENPLASINLQARQDSSVLAPIEKTISSGGPLILSNYCSKWDDLLMPLIDHCSAADEKSSHQDTSSIISFNGHRLLCADSFRLYLTADELEPNLNTEISSGTTIINYNVSEESLIELLLRRTFAKLQPDLYSTFMETANIILVHQQNLTHLEKKTRKCFISSQLNNLDDDINFIAVSEEKEKIVHEMEKAKLQLNDLLQVRDELYPVAQHGALFYTVLKSLQALAKEYYFSFDFFLNLFDLAIGTKDKAQEDFSQVNEAHREDSSQVAPPLRNNKSDQQGEVAAIQEATQETEDAVSAHKTQLPPTSDEPHSSIQPSNQIRRILDQLIQAEYQLIIQSLLPEHSTQACALLFLCMQHIDNKNVVTEEEISFFMKGSFAFRNVNLKSVNSSLKSPSWLPYEKWEELMVLSAISEQLSHLCEQVAENASEWEKWYKSDYQNVEISDASGVFKLPLCSAEESQWDFFHRLLVIRSARPDCFPDAVCKWVKQLSSGLEFHQDCQSVESIAAVEQNIYGILVLEPSSTTTSISYSGAILSQQAKQAIVTAAEKQSIPLFVVSVKNDNEEEVKAALNDTMNQNGWLIIESLHLASKAMLKNLLKSLRYAAKMRGSQKEERQFCVWITTELRASIPKDFLAHLKKVSWHFLILNENRQNSSLNDVIYIDNIAQLLLSGITSALNQTDEETRSRVKMNPATIQRLYFGSCVVHGVLQTLQLFPRTGLNHLIEVSPVELHQALNVILCIYDKMKTCDNNFCTAVVEGVCTVYSALSLTSVDASYIEALVFKIITSTFHRQESLTINRLCIPIPTDDVDIADYSSWLINHLQAKNFQKDSLLPSTTKDAANNTYASEFIHSLSAMYDSMHSSLPLTSHEDCSSVEQLAYLRAVIESVLEQLPQLIQTDGINVTVEESFFINNETAQDLHISNHVLLQECNWMNVTLKQINQSVSKLSSCLVGGLTVIPEHLRDIAEALQEAEVPKAWLSSHSCQTSQKITTWLEGLHKKHKQLKQWVKKGLMPFAKSKKEAMTSINLGGLVNPEALLLALRSEFAVHHGYLLHEVILQCHITENSGGKADREIYALYLQDLVLLGAAWDLKTNRLKSSRDMVNPLPYVMIIPTLRGNVKQSDDGIEFYQCPVYMDYTMQSCVMRLPLLCTKPVAEWHLQQVAIILNPDIGFRTSGEFPHLAKKAQRTIPLLNSLTKVDKSSHSRIFSRPSRSKDSLLVEAAAQEAPASNDVESLPTDIISADTSVMETANESTSLQKNLSTDTVGEITVSSNNLAPNQDNGEFIRGDVNDGHQMVSGPDENEDGNEMRKSLAEGTAFRQFQAEETAGTVNEPFIRERLIEHTRNTDYELSDKEHGQEDNNGNFDESENELYKEDLDTKIPDTLNASVQDNSDYVAGENHAGFIYEQVAVEDNEQEANDGDSTPHRAGNESQVYIRESYVKPLEESKNNMTDEDIVDNDD
ncbi:uncharacterized protein [Hyperolius riggenbachi]|uniref:uncharacterized protein n=1 Tax=Hyperolius riggenbachi TaxID=752182 RepID=UPI0035A2B060